MSTYEITASRKDGPDYDRRIDALMVGGSLLLLDTVITMHDQGDRFFTWAGGLFAWAHPARHPISGRRYMTTSPDGFGPNNLLALPDC